MNMPVTIAEAESPFSLLLNYNKISSSLYDPVLKIS